MSDFNEQIDRTTERQNSLLYSDHDKRHNNVHTRHVSTAKTQISKKSMNEWCFKSRRQLRSFWALINILTVNDEIIKIET